MLLFREALKFNMKHATFTFFIGSKIMAFYRFREHFPHPAGSKPGSHDHAGMSCKHVMQHEALHDESSVVSYILSFRCIEIVVKTAIIRIRTNELEHNECRFNLNISLSI